MNVTAGGKMIKSVTVSTVNGVQVAASQKNATIVTIDVNTLTSGIYVVNITTEDGSYSRKVMKVE